MHIYGEQQFIHKQPGFNKATIKTMVEWTHEDNLYLVLVAGNVGDRTYNTDYINKFWTIYADLFKDETHVIAEITNEPGHKGDLNKFFQGAADIIQKKAPGMPMLFFSEPTLGSSISAAKGYPLKSVDWSSAAVSYHGYGEGTKADQIKELFKMGVPVFFTEWNYKKSNNVDQIKIVEELGVSWVNFVPLDDCFKSDGPFMGPIKKAGIKWVPDMGSWPLPCAGKYCRKAPSTEVLV